MLDCFFYFFFLVYAGWDEGVAQVSVCLYFTIFMWGWEGEGGGWRGVYVPVSSSQFCCEISVNVNLHCEPSLSLTFLLL